MAVLEDSLLQVRLPAADYPYLLTISDGGDIGNAPLPRPSPHEGSALLRLRGASTLTGMTVPVRTDMGEMYSLGGRLLARIPLTGGRMLDVRCLNGPFLVRLLHRHRQIAVRQASVW